MSNTDKDKDNYAYDETIGKLVNILSKHHINIRSKLDSLSATKDSKILLSIITSLEEVEKQINKLIDDTNTTKMPELSDIAKKINVQLDNYKDEIDKTMNNLSDKNNLTPESFNKILSELTEFSNDFKRIVDAVKLLKPDFNNKVAPSNNPFVEVKSASLLETMKVAVIGLTFQDYILFFIGIAIVIIISLGLTLKYDKNMSSSASYKTILSISCFTFAVVIIGYLYYLNNIIKNTTTFTDKLKALRNSNIVYLMLMLAGIFIFYTLELQSVMRKHQEKTMILTAVISSLYFMYVIRYDYNNMTTELFKTLGGAFLIALFTYNPFNITPKLSGVNVSFIMLAIIFFITMILYYNNIYTDSSIFTFPNIKSGFKNIFFIIFSTIVSLGVILLIFASFGAFNTHSEKSGTYLLNIAIIVGMLSILYNVIDSSGILKNHPAFRLIVACVLYIPCLITNVLEMLLKEYYQTTNFTMVLIVIEIILILISIYYPQFMALFYTSDDGMLLINNPVDLSTKQIVSYYETLSGNNIVDLIKNPNITKIIVGNDVQVKQDSSNQILNKINTGSKDEYFECKITKIHKVKRRDLYDICYEDDKTYQYNVLRSEIKPDDIQLTLGLAVKATKKWLVGTIDKINFNGSYVVKYKTDLPQTEIDAATKNGIHMILVKKDINPEDIMLINEINPDKNAYRFALSFWVFINSLPPNTNENYNKYTSLLNYTNNPNVMYNPSTHDFIVSVNQNVETPESSNTDININNDKNKELYNIIYSNKNMPLQKWNNIVINYDSGIMDIFFNGDLVQSSNKILPNIKYRELTVGTDKGIKAGLCNLVYFKEPMNIITINNLYNITKTKKTPSVPDKNLFSL